VLIVASSQSPALGALWLKSVACASPSEHMEAALLALTPAALSSLSAQWAEEARALLAPVRALWLDADLQRALRAALTLDADTAHALLASALEDVRSSVRSPYVSTWTSSCSSHAATVRRRRARRRGGARAERAGERGARARAV